jgi:acyl-CoA reductase-like NAD-dependent aldehyde dehydrogenase
VELLRVGPAEEFATDVPALIDDDAVSKVGGYAALCEGRELVRAEAPAGGQYFPPTLAGDLPDDSPVLREEVFGPLLTVEAVRDLDQAVGRVRSLPQALTGGIFSRHPEHVERLVGGLPAGNLYVNRHITGAVVARQPFGGNGLSGTGARTGSRRYLWRFTDDQVVSENTLRHGLELS